MSRLLSTREVAEMLGIHEKKVYSLVNEQGLPATKVTGKWLFPKDLVDQWVENNTVNYPKGGGYHFKSPSLFVVAGSNDVLLERGLGLFMRIFPEYTAVFGNVGSKGGLRTLRQNLCHIATSHLVQEDEEDFNFTYLEQEMDNQPAVVNFAMRQQGLIVYKGNPKQINAVSDITEQTRMVNRSLATGTRLWFDKALKREGLQPESIPGYHREVQSHLQAGLEVLSGNADVAPGIRAVTDLLGLDFVPFHWERFDLLIGKERFFDRNIQSFLGMLHEQEFRDFALELPGYDLSQSGKMVYPSS